MKLAAIDIGSNAIRLQITRVIRTEMGTSFKRLEYIRFPLRLGKEVFQTGQLGKAAIDKFEKLMRTFMLLIDLYEVDGYTAVGTSALREAENGRRVIQQIGTYFNLKINIISGEQEAEYLSKAIIPNLDNRPYLHIDVGGGSTELNYYVDRLRKRSASFQLGSVRKLNPVQRKQVSKDIKEWCQELVEAHSVNKPMVGIGTGGNIQKLYKLSNNKLIDSVSLAELRALKSYLETFTYQQRMDLLKMNPDRADVIIPASDIYIEVLRSIRADRIMVPSVGLKDGLLYDLYEQMSGDAVQDIEFID